MVASQETVSRAAGIHPRRWSRLEAGSEPTVSEALLIASLQGVTVLDLAHLADSATLRQRGAPPVACSNAMRICEAAGWKVKVPAYYLSKALRGESSWL